VKEAVVKALASVENAPGYQKSAVQEDLYKKYQYCMQDYRYVPSSFYAAAQ
jgi:hypothetical protein